MMEGTVWRWLNEPAEWHQTSDGLQVVTDQQTDFWRSTWFDILPHLRASRLRRGIPITG